MSEYGQLRAKQEASGKTLGNLDLLIAAHAIAVGAVLVTNDKAFSSVADLPKIVNWATTPEISWKR
jgi:tRNA(fMet)-specific endonuclease VapC